jgi:hypothetical protein
VGKRPRQGSGGVERLRRRGHEYTKPTSKSKSPGVFTEKRTSKSKSPGVFSEKVKEAGTFFFENFFF